MEELIDEKCAYGQPWGICILYSPARRIYVQPSAHQTHCFYKYVLPLERVAVLTALSLVNLTAAISRSPFIPGAAHYLSPSTAKSFPCLPKSPSIVALASGVRIPLLGDVLELMVLIAVLISLTSIGVLCKGIPIIM